jgi:hypothetical protein
VEWLRNVVKPVRAVSILAEIRSITASANIFGAIALLFSFNAAATVSFQAREESKVVFPPPVVKTEVTVIITDINDEIPTFRSKSYLAEVNENAQVNTPVTFLNSAVPEVFDHDQVIIDSDCNMLSCSFPHLVSS